MATFELWYPDETTQTLGFAPSRCPLIAGSRHSLRSNAIVHQTPDERVTYVYSRAPAYRERPYVFVLTESELTNGWVPFWQAVLGQSFKLKDQMTGSNYVLVRLSPQSLDIDWEAVNANDWQATIIFRDAVS